MNPESSIKRFIGKETPELSKEQARKTLEDRFANPEFAAIEREKTPEEKEIITFVNEKTNELLAAYGIEPFDVPVENIHFIKEDEWQKRTDATAIYYNQLQGIVLRDLPQKMVLANTVFHEMLHFKSFNGIELVDDVMEEQRSGIRTHTRPERQDALRGINEAVIEELSKRFTLSLQEPLFKKEIEESKTILAKKDFGEDAYYASLVSEEDKTATYEVARFAYAEERNNLTSLIHKIRERSSRSFGSDEEVFSIFVQALFKPNLLELGKLLDETFGVGTFRKIALMNKDHEASKEFIDSL